MAGTTGLEPATSDVTGRRSNQLNYVPAMSREHYDASTSMRLPTNLRTPRRSERSVFPRITHVIRARRPLRLSVRLRSPGFAATAIITLALGIGATTAIFSVCDAMLWKPIPLPDIQSLVIIEQGVPGDPNDFADATPADIADIRAQSQSFAGSPAISKAPPTSSRLAASRSAPINPWSPPTFRCPRRQARTRARVSFRR